MQYAQTGLDPYFGCFHAMDYGRASLLLDLMEEYRTIISDTVALSIFNLKIVDENDFIFKEEISDSGESVEEALKLTEPALKKILVQFERDLDKVIKIIYKIINEDIDSVRYYKLCFECEYTIDIIGNELYIPKQGEYYIL